MMKTIKYFIILGAVGIMSLFTACDKNLDLEPELGIDHFLVYVNEDGVKSALDGAWDILGNQNFFAGTSIFFSDLLGANGSTRLVWDGTFIGYRNMYRKSLDKNDGLIANKWISAYRAINICNNVLANLDKISAGDRGRVEGEAKFIRGVLLFDLVRFYAQPWGFTVGNTHDGVPIVLTPVQTLEDITMPARATVAAVYTQIQLDLGAAKTLLPVGKAGANRGLATSTNASAFLTRVHFSKKEWVETAREATIVIDQFLGAAALNATPRACFNNSGYTSEDVFMVRQNLYSNAGQANDGIGTFFASMPGFGRGDVRIQSAQLGLFEPADLRGGLEDNPDAKVIAEISKMYYWGYGTRSGRRRCTKWGSYDTYIPVIRIAEMLLTRAEANFMDPLADVGDSPFNDLNAIRARARATLIALPGDVNLALIQSDRYKELCFEGHSLADLKRWGGSVVTPSGSQWGTGVVLNWDDWRLILPIPQREIEVNPSLVQNTNY